MTPAEAEALDNIRAINRELLLAAGSDIPTKASEHLHTARQQVIEAIRRLDPPAPDTEPPLEELDVDEYRKKIASHLAGDPFFKRVFNRIQDPEKN